MEKKVFGEEKRREKILEGKSRSTGGGGGGGEDISTSCRPSRCRHKISCTVSQMSSNTIQNSVTQTAVLQNLAVPRELPAVTQAYLLFNETGKHKFSQA